MVVGEIAGYNSYFRITCDTIPKTGLATPVVSAVNVRVSRDCF
jgi:hypothetical protein